MGYIRPATVEDAKLIAPRLREADRMEVEAISGLPPEVLLPLSVEKGYRTWTAITNSGERVGIFGVDPSPADPRLGIVWMLNSDAVEKHRTEFLLGSRKYLPVLHQEFPLLTNLVDARNTLHHKWLRWLGFSFLRKIERWGARGVPVFEFARLQP